MGRANQPEDVFKSINMHGGDTSVCWEWQGSLNDKGLPYFSLFGTKKIAYRVIYELVHGDLEPGEVVRHTCDNGADRVGRGWVCCNPTHLEKGTHQDNMNDMKERNRHGLSAHVIRNIRKLLAAGRGHQEIADLYGIARQTVTDINNGTTHSHVQDVPSDGDNTPS